MLGYSVLLLLLVGISVFALFNLNQINKINSSILETDLPITNISGQMVDVILAQELYVQRYLILKSPDVFKDFWNKQKEFNALTEQLHGAAPGHLPLLIGADQEGGQLVGLGHDTTRFPGAMALGAADDLALMALPSATPTSSSAVSRSTPVAEMVGA